MIRPAAIMLAATMLTAGTVHADEQPAVLSTTGRATLEIPADQLRISLGVETAGKTVEDANASAVETMDGIIRAMDKLGLERKTEYTIERYNVETQWSPRPRNPEPNWRPTIVGYTVNAQMRIKTGKLELAGRIISAGVDAGANEIGNIVFDLADPRNSRDKVIRDATQNAMDDASSMAKAAGVELVRIQSLSLDGSNYQPRQFKAAADYGRAATLERAYSAPPAPIVSGDVTVNATVQLTWLITGP